MTEYVAGFMLDGQNVALVVKNRPEWQKGRMNGIGGHIELDETPEQAMVREFVEETGYSEKSYWHKFAELSGEDWRVYFFWSLGDHSVLRSTTDEKIVSIPCDTINHVNCVPNLQWLVPMARSMEHNSANLFKITEVR